MLDAVHFLDLAEMYSLQSIDGIFARKDASSERGVLPDDVTSRQRKWIIVWCVVSMLQTRKE